MLTSDANRFSDGALVSYYTEVDMHLGGSGKNRTWKRRQERSSPRGQILGFGQQRWREIFGSWERQEIFGPQELLEIFGPRWQQEIIYTRK